MQGATAFERIDEKVRNAKHLMRAYGRPRGFSEEHYLPLTAIHRLKLLHEEFQTPEPDEWFRRMEKQTEWNVPSWMPEADAKMLRYLVDNPDQRKSYLEIYDGLAAFLKGLE